MAPRKRSRLGKAWKNAEHTWDTTKERVQDAREQGEDVIKTHPFTSVIVAAAVGALVGVGISILSRSKDSSFLDRLRDYL